MQILVDSADEWYEYVVPAIVPFGLSPEPPVNRPWGTRDFVLTDPSGVRWRITQPKREAENPVGNMRPTNP